MLSVGRPRNLEQNVWASPGAVTLSPKRVSICLGLWPSPEKAIAYVFLIVAGMFLFALWCPPGELLAAAEAGPLRQPKKPVLESCPAAGPLWKHTLLLPGQQLGVLARLPALMEAVSIQAVLRARKIHRLQNRRNIQKDIYTLGEAFLQWTLKNQNS